MQNRGDRLVYSSGIVVLAALASILVIVFQADEIHMLPLYALGVFISFTLSQAGMARLMGKVGRVPPGEELSTGSTTIHYESGWRWKQALGAFRALITFVVLIVLTVTKFREGAWIVALAIPLLIWLFYSIKGRYNKVATALRTRDFSPAELLEVADVVIVPIADVHRGTLRALKYARRLSRDVRAISVVSSKEQLERLERRWARFPEITGDIKLIPIENDYRDILTPIVDYVEYVTDVEHPCCLTTVVIPEFIPDSLAEQLLHNQTANLLRVRLHGHHDVVVIDVPYHI